MYLSQLVKKTIIIFLFFISGLNVKTQTCDYYSSIIDDCNMLGSINYVGTSIDANICFNKQWEVVFEDNFDGNSIDYTEKWRHHLNDGNGLMDKSLDYHLLDENIQVSNGTAKLITRQENIEAHALTYCQNGSSDIDNCIQNDGIKNKRTFNFTSGALWTDRTFDIGKIEIRCKLPNIDGLWPAFWLYGVGQCVQEIDVFEFLNGTYSESASVSNSRAIMTYHRSIDCPNNFHCPPNLSITYPKGTAQTFISCTDYSQDFHIFSVEWDAYQITWKIDGVIRRVIYGLINELDQTVDECNLSSAATYLWNPNMPLAVNPMHMSIGVGVKNFSTATNPALSPLSRGTYPAVMEVDYVRAYKRVPIPTCDAEPDLLITSLGPMPANPNYLPNRTISAKNAIVTIGAVTPLPGQTWRSGSYIELNPGFETNGPWTGEIGGCVELFGRLGNPDTTKHKGGITDTLLQQELYANVQKENTENKNEIAISSEAGNNRQPLANDNQQSSPDAQILNPEFPIYISPNPSNDGKFNLQCTLNDVGCMDAEITIMNALGQIIHSAPLSNYQFPAPLDISTLPHGAYLIKIRNADKVFVHKVVYQ